MAREHVLVSQLSDALKVRPDDLPERVHALMERIRDADRELDRLRAAQLLQAAAGVAAGATDIGSALVAVHRAPDGTSSDDLRRLASDVVPRLPAERVGVVVVAGVADGRPSTVVAVNHAARAAGLTARDLVRQVAAALGGGGGGKDDIAQGGGSDAAAVDPALREVPSLVAQALPAA